MSKATATVDWREARRRSARDAIVDAAWELVHEEGLAALSLRDLAERAGITTPTVYAYFDSKNAIYDAMFGRAATEFADRMTQPFDAADPRALLVASARRFVEFCTSDVARYQLLFQRTIPDFEPSAESYAPAVRPRRGSGTPGAQRHHAAEASGPVDGDAHGSRRSAGLQRPRRELGGPA